MNPSKRIPASLWILAAILAFPILLSALMSVTEMADKDCSARMGDKASVRTCP